jgi:hypothetical protein
MYKAIRILEEYNRAVNLICPDWLNVLKEYPVYQKHVNRKAKYGKGKSCAKEKAYVRTIIDGQFNVIVAGEFSLVRGTEDEDEYSIVARSCEPLREIGLVMQDNPEWKLHDGGRYFVKTCEPRYCYFCKEEHKNRDIQLPRKNNWCVQSVRVFDGKFLFQECTTPLRDSLLEMKSFFAVFYMQISSRTTFGDNSYKIGGLIKEMIVFQENVLVPRQLENMQSQPAIEYKITEEP